MGIKAAFLFLHWEEYCPINFQLGILFKPLSLRIVIFGLFFFGWINPMENIALFN
jgi:hypothetical protein